jgi:hypothetical protein
MIELEGVAQRFSRSPLPRQGTAPCGHRQACVLFGHLDPDALHGEPCLANPDRLRSQYAERVGDLAIASARLTRMRGGIGCAR